MLKKKVLTSYTECKRNSLCFFKLFVYAQVFSRKPQCSHRLNLLILFLLMSHFKLTCLICMLVVQQTKQKVKKKTKEKEKECSPAMCTVLFMKALPGTMETNYLLTMWNRILFTRLRFPLLFQMRFFTASSFVSHSIIVSIFQNQSVSRKEQGKKGEWITAVHKTSH